MQLAMLTNFIQRRTYLIKLYNFLLAVLHFFESNREIENMPRRQRSARRLQRNSGWWKLVWETYSEERFKKTFRLTRETFQFILDRIYHLVKKQSITEDAIPPECRLGVCLYRLGRGDYYYTLAELSGLGEATICLIVIEVCQVMVHTFWMEEVSNLFPQNQEELNKAMELMDEEWQFPCAYAAIDGCHIPIRCPPGGAEAAKEFHNFKNFYSVILMAIVDAKYRIIWGRIPQIAQHCLCHLCHPS